MKRQWLDMIYDREQERWGVVMDEEVYSMHCGEKFEIYLGNQQSCICRLELDQEWYVIMGEISFQLRNKQTYWIAI